MSQEETEKDINFLSVVKPLFLDQILQLWWHMIALLSLFLNRYRGPRCCRNWLCGKQNRDRSAHKIALPNCSSQNKLQNVQGGPCSFWYSNFYTEKRNWNSRNVYGTPETFMGPLKRKCNWILQFCSSVEAPVTFAFSTNVCGRLMNWPLAS